MALHRAQTAAEAQADCTATAHQSESKQPELFSYLFFASLIATTFLF